MIVHLEPQRMRGFERGHIVVQPTQQRLAQTVGARDQLQHREVQSRGKAARIGTVERSVEPAPRRIKPCAPCCDITKIGERQARSGICFATFGGLAPRQRAANASRFVMMGRRILPVIGAVCQRTEQAERFGTQITWRWRRCGDARGEFDCLLRLPLLLKAPGFNKLTCEFSLRAIIAGFSGTCVGCCDRSESRANDCHCPKNCRHFAAPSLAIYLYMSYRRRNFWALRG
ncbi:hypothetical protein [Sphingomonas baiyangensis]|uniref:hypothetical protein n=1 Tax=Sphingomonas baiyangensis TaxID=2572576 RepID=UPI001BAE6E48|nr:hypothetical protein [Sphingomonas baiyangensis]